MQKFVARDKYCDNLILTEQEIRARHSDHIAKQAGQPCGIPRPTAIGDYENIRCNTAFLFYLRGILRLDIRLHD